MEMSHLTLSHLINNLIQFVLHLVLPAFCCYYLRSSTISYIPIVFPTATVAVELVPQL